MTAVRCWYVVVDSYPTSPELFSQYVSAVFGCWIREDEDATEARIRAQLDEFGWRAAREIGRGFVEGADYPPARKGRAEYLDAVERGCAFHAHLRRRESVALDGVAGGLGYREYVMLVRRLRLGGWSLFAPSGEQYANGVTPDGDDFVPLWTSREGAREWRAGWPDCVPVHLGLDELLGPDGWLQAVAAEDMWVGIEAGASLVMVHPLQVRHDLGSRVSVE